MREWSKQLVRWPLRQGPAVDGKGSAPYQVQPPATPTMDNVPEPVAIDVEAWLEQKAKESNGDWRLARLSGFSRGEDAEARQIAAASLQPTEELWLEPAPEDLYSTLAVRVRTVEGTTVGYLEPSVAETISRQIREGDLFRCFVYKVNLNERQLPSNVLLALISKVFFSVTHG